MKMKKMNIRTTEIEYLSESGYLEKAKALSIAISHMNEKLVVILPEDGKFMAINYYDISVDCRPKINEYFKLLEDGNGN